MAALYDRQYAEWKQWPEEDFGRYDEREAVAFALEIARLPLHTDSALRVLDVGFGNGAFLAWAQTRGYRCEGVELNAALRERAARRGVPAYADVAVVPAQTRYDLITAFDVCEHIPRDALTVFFQRLYALLDNGGVILLRVPSGDSPLAGFYQNGDLTHCSVLGSGSVRQLAQSCDLELIHAGPPASPASLKFRLRDAGRALVEYVIGRLYYDGQRVSLDPLLVAALRKKAVRS